MKSILNNLGVKRIMLIALLNTVLWLLFLFLMADLTRNMIIGVLLAAGFILCMMMLLLLYYRKRHCEMEAGFRAIERQISRLFNNIELSFALNQCLVPDLPLPNTRGWAASPDLIALMVRHIFITKPGKILELGSGVSTLYLGYALRKLGAGAIWSIEHSETHFKNMQAEIALHKLEQFIRIVHCPLKQFNIQGTFYDWYDPLSIPDEINEIGMLIVDGPPSIPGQRTRYPALPVLFGKLEAGAHVFIDDYLRADDKLTVAQWLQEYPRLRLLAEPDTEKGTAILQKQ